MLRIQGLVKVKLSYLKYKALLDNIFNIHNIRKYLTQKITTSQAKELKKQLRELPDIRKARGKRHPAVSILAIAICAMLSGCSNFTAIASFSKALQPKHAQTIRVLFSRG